ncbi:MAG TPA: hypothetical protein VK175_10780 [Leadbetterella sp.]|nr:hypothetical protein [Leadbetterella sp.]
MRALVVFFGLILFGATATAQYDYNDEYGTSYDGPDRYFYDENFDWRWDVRVRISDGIDNGSLTRREADRLYNKLERIERKEYAYQSDGFLSAFEQDEIWEDVVDLNRLIGIELRDWDRTYYGYSARGLSYRGYSPWYFGNSYDFYRFDRRGYGSISFGYRPRAFFPHNHVYYRNRSYTSNWSHRNNNWNRNDNWDRDRSWNRSNNWDRDRNWNNSNSRSRTENRNNNRNNIESRGSRPSDGRSNSGSWSNENSRSSSPSTSPRNEGGRTRSEAPSTSSRSRENNRREEIQTPRPSTRSTDGGRSNRGSEGGRTSLPDRGKTNDSGRRGNNF